MSQIKEINTLGTIASIRKATQDSLKPIIEEIERKMVAMNDQTVELASKTQKIVQLQKRQLRSQQITRYLQTQMIDLKQLCQQVHNKQQIDKAKYQRNEQAMKEEFNKFKKQIQSQDAIIQAVKDKNERMNKELNSTLSTLKARESALQVRFNTLNQRSQTISFQVKSSSDKMKQQFEQIRNTLNHQLKANSRRLQLLDMYEIEKEFVNKKIKQMSETLDECVKQQQFQFYKDCNTKQQERVVTVVKKIIDDNLSQKTRQLLLLLPQMRQQILHCLQFQTKIDEINHRIMEIKRLIQANRFEFQTAHNRLKSNIYDRFIIVQEQRVQMLKDINKSLSFQMELIVKLDEYSERLKDELREQNEMKSRELYNQIKISFADKKEQIREQQLQNIVDQRLKLFDKCQDIEKLGNKIGQVLTNFSTRITKMKSDNQIFVDKVKRQLLSVEDLRALVNSNASTIGEVFSQIMETILINNCIQIEKQSKNDEELAFSTHQDGVIYQKYIHKQGQLGNILYRRKVFNTKLLKRAAIASLTHLYDKIMQPNSCLCWRQHSPSHYFKDQIEPIYQNLSFKLIEAIDANQDKMFKTRRLKDNDSLTNHLGKDTILTTFQNNEPIRKFATTHRSRKTRYEDNAIFLPKSARKGRGSMNTTIALE